MQVVVSWSCVYLFVYLSVLLHLNPLLTCVVVANMLLLQVAFAISAFRFIVALTESGDWERRWHEGGSLLFRTNS